MTYVWKVDIIIAYLLICVQQKQPVSMYIPVCNRRNCITMLTFCLFIGRGDSILLIFSANFLSFSEPKSCRFWKSAGTHDRIWYRSVYVCVDRGRDFDALLSLSLNAPKNIISIFLYDGDDLPVRDSSYYLSIMGTFFYQDQVCNTRITSVISVRKLYLWNVLYYRTMFLDYQFKPMGM